MLKFFESSSNISQGENIVNKSFALHIMMLNIKKAGFTFFLLFELVFAQAQTYYPFGFERDQSVVVLNQYSDTLLFPWIGGLNAVHIHEIDLNLDGINDIIIFDKTGNRLLPFINQNIQGTFSYIFAPEYKRYFPPDLRSWIITYDYNHDGRKDLFTYYPGGIRLFKNISDTILKFELISNMLTSLQFNNFINIYVTDDDYPAITDIDGDGDVDILVFYILGNYVELHQNMGVELFNNPDTLIFHRTNRCWGNFLESDNSNELTLNIVCPFQTKSYEPYSPEHTLHVGSTMFIHDVNNDNLPDLILGDTDYPNLILLINGGTLDSAHMVSQDILFPSNTLPVHLFSMPVVSFVDLNNDGINEVLVSVFSSSLELNESKKSLWLYNNHGTNQDWNLEFVMDNFLQSESIDVGSGAYPVLVDYDGDGLVDLMVANFGNRDSSWYENGFLYSSFTSTISLYRNVGTQTTPVFQLITEDFANLSSLGLRAIYPAFADLDGDGDLDMVIGHRGGTLYYFENTAGVGQPMSFQLISTNWLNINVGQFSAPVFFDLTENGLPDLVVGNRNGTLYFYENTGTTLQPQYVLRTTNFGNVNTADLTFSYFGHSTPSFFKYQNEIYLLTGSNRGWLLLFKNIAGNLTGTFELVDTIFTVGPQFQKERILEGWRTAACLYDLNNDGYPEMIVGNYSGGLSFFRGTEPPPDFVAVHQPPVSIKPSLFPNPARDFITIEFPSFPHKVLISIYHINGLLYKQEIVYQKKQHTLYIENLPSGVYIVKCTVWLTDYKIQTITSRFLKQ